MLKNKLLKILGVVLFMGLILSAGKVSAAPKCKIEARTLTIYNKTPGELTGAISFLTQNKQPYDHLVITGNLSYLEFVNVEIMAKECKTVDLSGLKFNRGGIPNGSFEDYEKLEVLIFPKDTRLIGALMCYSCRNLKTVVLPKNLETVGDGAFQYCQSLHLTIPKNVRVGEGIGRGSPGVIIAN